VAAGGEADTQRQRQVRTTHRSPLTATCSLLTRLPAYRWCRRPEPARRWRPAVGLSFKWMRECSRSSFGGNAGLRGVCHIFNKHIRDFSIHTHVGARVRAKTRAVHARAGTGSFRRGVELARPSLGQQRCGPRWRQAGVGHLRCGPSRPRMDPVSL